MKKLFKTVAVLAAALAVGMLASCKMNEDSGGNFGNVSESVTANKKGYVIMDLTDEPEVGWYRWTNGTKGVRGPVVDGSKFKVYNVTKKADPKNSKKFTYEIDTSRELTDYGTIASNKIVAFDLPAGDYNFYYYQKGDATPKSKTNKNNDATTIGKKDSVYDLDRVGYIKVDKEKTVAVHLDDVNWKYVTKQGEFQINVNEPITNSSATAGTFFWQGDYTVTELWPLKESKTKEGTVIKGAYEINEDLKYQELEVKKAGNSKTVFLLPEGKQIVTTFQPRRGIDPEFPNDPSKDARSYMKVVSDDTASYTANIRKPAADELNTPAAREMTKTELDAKVNEYWGLSVDIKAHGTTFDYKSTTKTPDNKNGNLVTYNDKTIVDTNMFDTKFAKVGKKEFTDPKNNRAAYVEGVTYLDVVPAMEGEK